MLFFAPLKVAVPNMVGVPQKGILFKSGAVPAAVSSLISILTLFATVSTNETGRRQKRSKPEDLPLITYFKAFGKKSRESKQYHVSFPSFISGRFF